jgi:hypothetical protein
MRLAADRRVLGVRRRLSRRFGRSAVVCRRSTHRFDEFMTAKPKSTREIGDRYLFRQLEGVVSLCRLDTP